MITGPKKQFEARLRERGYSLDEVRACVVSDDGDTITVDETHESYPRSRKPGRGLGDLVTDGLSAVGITKERVERIVGGPCGCSERAEWLNQAGAKYLGMPSGRNPH